VSQLHKAYEEGKCEKCRKIAAFEMAICSFLRFGNARSYGDHETWLEKSGHTKTDLEEAVLTARMVVLALDNSSPHESDKYLFAVNLSSDYQDLTLGEFQVLERSLIEEAEGCAQAFTEMNSVVVDLKRALAFLYQSRSMFREAAEIQEHIVRVISETIGDDPVGMKVRGDLSVTYVHLGRLHEAKELRTFVLNWLRKHYSPEDLHALSTMISLAGVTNNLGQHLEAEKLLLEALDVLKTKLGMENQMTLSAMTRLAAVYYDQNRLSEAEHLQLQVIELYKSSLGLDHELTWTTQLNLAAILSKLGRIKEAQQLELKILDLRKKRFGLKHDLTLTAIANLAAGYRLQKCWKEEESCLLQVVEGRKEVLGLFHPDTLLSSQALGNNYLHQGKYEAAESILRQVVQARTLLRGKSHPSTMASLNSLARVVFDKGDREKAEAMQLQTIKQGTKTLGESNVAVLECKRHLALMYQSWNRLGDAKILLTDVCNARKAALDKDHPDLNRVAQQIEDIDLKLAKTVKDE
jgi:tetratricopeptide (TPR) repeat protein